MLFAVAVAGVIATAATSATSASPDATPPRARGSITVRSLNVLHGVFCPRGSGQCRLDDRLDLALRWVTAHACPDVVALQEVSRAMLPKLTAALPRLACPFRYRLAHRPANGIDDALVLSRYPVVDVHEETLVGGFRRALLTRIAHPLGPLDVVVTHLSSTLERADRQCDAGCPAYCTDGGAVSVRECQSRQVAAIVAVRHRGPLPAIVAIDLNAAPDSSAYRGLRTRGWIDAQLEAGNAECDARTGAGCTAGRPDDVLVALERRESLERERIDYVFVVPSRETACSLDGPRDTDRDGIATGTFADRPNPFARTCGPAPSPICWASDHAGVAIDLNCVANSTKDVAR